MKKLLIISGMTLLIYACSTSIKKIEDTADQSKVSNLFTEDSASKALAAKGIGKFTQVDLDSKLDIKLAALGSGIYDLKCSACHKLTNEKLVGPGWKDVTVRRHPEWIMNFSTNTDEMISKDPQAQAMLEECMVRMPNQSLSDEDARNVLEFMRKNDGVK